MSKASRILAVAAGGALVLGSLATGRAAEGSMSHGVHGASHEGMTHAQAGAPAAGAPGGTFLRESQVLGYTLSYRLYSWEERNAMMKGMEGHQMAGMDATGKSTHHLMVFASGPDGKELSGGKVGFVVIAPDKSEFKTLTMAMSGGYGADIPLRAKGDHTIRTKAVFGDRTLNEEFKHTVK